MENDALSGLYQKNPKDFYLNSTLLIPHSTLIQSGNHSLFEARIPHNVLPSSDMAVNVAAKAS